MSFKIAGVEVTHLTHDSRTVTTGSCFFAIRGETNNGNMYVEQAIAKGASIIVAEEKLNIAIPQLTVPNVREFMALAAKRFQNNICDKMNIVAVVGTNGKTTCTYMLRHIIGKNVGVIGTLGAFVGDKRLDSNLTTPDPIALHEIFAKMYAMRVRTVVMEVSAHAIHYNKVAGINFRAGLFTNLTQDHLDFFGTFEKYAQSKVNFLSSACVKTAIINSDDAYGIIIADKRGKDTVDYSISDAWNLKLTPTGATFELGRHEIALKMAGRFNVYNALGCCAVARELGINMRQIKKAFATLPPVDGRFNVYAHKGFSIIIDYAHSPDGLEKILTSAREIAPNGRIFSVFGCGGNRDKTKREIMGQIAAKQSDYVVITSDNPRDESPRAIMLQIEQGVKTVREDNYQLIEDRRAAIHYALDNARDGDIVVIAGKGAETTQEIAGKFLPFIDAEVVKQYILENENTQDNL